MPLPSKKITPILLACLCASGTIIYAVKYSTPTPAVASRLIVQPQQLPSDIPVSDDSWKNTLAAVAPAHAETTRATSAATASTSDEKTTATQALARDLLSNYLSLEQSSGQGGQLSQDAQDTLAQQIVFDSETNEPLSLQTINYTASDLNKGTDDSAAARRAYGNAVAAMILNNPPKGNTDTELSIMYKSVDAQDPNELKKLQPIIDAYKIMETGILKIKTPPSAESLQLNLVNDFDALVTVDTRLENFYSDSVDGLYAIKDYQTASVNIANDFQAFKMYFDESNITFTPADPAQQFINTM